MYRIIQTKKFTAQVTQLYDEHPRMEEFNKAITWFLGRTPRSSLCYNLFDGHFLWVTDRLSTPTIPTVKIVYHVNDEARIVKLISIEEHTPQP